jgi:hypothetical protein
MLIYAISSWIAVGIFLVFFPEADPTFIFGWACGQTAMALLYRP